MTTTLSSTPGRGTCPVCKKGMSLTRGRTGLCHRCTTTRKKCGRCGGALTSGYSFVGSEEKGKKIVCRSCRFKYQEAKKCAQCGRMTKRLSRAPSRGIDEPVCDTCRKKGTKVTCALCRRNRAFGKVDDQGRKICKACMSAQLIICLRCGATGNEFAGRLCFDCYWRQKATEAYREIRAEITRDWVRDLFDGFVKKRVEGKWPEAFHRRLPFYRKFFDELDRGIEDPGGLTLERLYELIGPGGLRRFVVPYRHLIDIGAVPVEPKGFRADRVEERRQGEIVAGASGRWYGPELSKYRDHLVQINHRYAAQGERRYVPKTITACLLTARRFFEFIAGETVREGVGPSDIRQIEREHFVHFLGRNTNARAQIGIFAKYLDEKVGMFRPIRLAPKRKRFRHVDVLHSGEYNRLLMEWGSASASNPKEALIGLFMLLFAQKPKKLSAMKMSQLARGEKGEWLVRFGKIPCPLHRTVQKVMERHLKEREKLLAGRNDADNEHLFPGELPGHPMSPESVRTALKKHGVNASTLFTTALANAFLHGLDSPRSAAKLFGVDFTTAVRYHQETAARAREEIEKGGSPPCG